MRIAAILAALASLLGCDGAGTAASDAAPSAAPGAHAPGRTRPSAPRSP